MPSQPPAKFFVNQGVVSSREDMLNLLRPLLKQTVTYRYQRGREGPWFPREDPPRSPRLPRSRSLRSDRNGPRLMPSGSKMSGICGTTSTSP